MRKIYQNKQNGVYPGAALLPVREDARELLFFGLFCIMGSVSCERSAADERSV